MIKINKISSIIHATDYAGDFGFEHEFKSGLNVICGDNSSGKSTILSCIYYCLGMEQLLGGNRNNILDKCLWNSFQYLERDYSVSHSKAILEIENSIGKKAIIERIIKHRLNASTNSLKVTFTDNEKLIEKTLFVHSNGDHHNEDGFYNWLKQFSGIKIPEILNSDNKIEKTLYLQNILSSSLIEQTKGWSDFFAQMPVFGIKNSRRKVVEFLLNLESLENDLKKDELINKANKYKEEWKAIYKSYNDYISLYNLELNGIQNEFKANITKASVNKSEVLLSYNSDLVLLEERLKALREEFKVLKQENSEIVNTKLNADQVNIINELKTLTRQAQKLKKQKISEVYKCSDYQKSKIKTEHEIARIEGVIKIGNKVNDFSKVSQCPVCDTSLKLEQRKNLNEEKIDYKSSIAFLRSQRDLYSCYLKNATDLIEKFDNTSHYYDEKISEKRHLLKELHKDFYSGLNISRASLVKEISINNEISLYERCLQRFEEFKSKAKFIVEEMEHIREAQRDLKLSSERDNAEISKFLAKFKALLFSFGYSSNKKETIVIEKEAPSNLLPCIKMKVFNGKDDIQPIRLSSSASDFIRAEWAFYLSLATSSAMHPGFIIFDEPGQHAMKKTSLRELLNHSSKLENRQVIVAISKDIKISDKQDNYNIDEILSDLEHSKYNLLDIDPENNNKCITPI